MLLTETQSRKALDEHGMYVTEACDKCGKLLGCVRYTHRRQTGEWCSELCRDGPIESGQARQTRRKGGRPPKYRNDGERRRANAAYQREFRRKKNPLAE